MLTDLEKVFRLPKEAAERSEAPQPLPTVDPTDIEAVAQHERDRLAALKVCLINVALLIPKGCYSGATHKLQQGMLIALHVNFGVKVAIEWEIG